MTDSTNFFDAQSPYLGHPLLTQERSAAEVHTICSLISSTERVLDAGCGFGRHSVEFARGGADVVGIDPSETMIAAARERASAAGVEVDFRQVRASDFVTDRPFDIVVCLFTTLGQLTSTDAPSDHVATLDALFAAVRPDGHIVVEVPERERAVAALVESEELGPTVVTRSFDAEQSVLTERFETPHGRFDLAYRLFGRSELTELVEGAGFRIEEINDSALSPPPDTFMTLYAYRPSS